MRTTASRLSIQGRVLFALIMREMVTRFGRSPGGYVWAVLEPAGGIALMSIVWSSFARMPDLGESFPLFFATGYIAFHTYNDISNKLSRAVQVNLPLLKFPRVTILDVILARFILLFLTVCFVGVVILGILVWVEGDRVRLTLSPIYAAIALAGLLGFSIGFFNCIAFAFSPTWERIYSILTRPLFIISGVFYTVEAMPKIIQDILWWNPLIHLTGLMRRGFYPGYEAAYVSIGYVALFILIPLMAAATLLPLMRRHLLER
jgi:capsular polysaccharide transport system permease protein